MCTVEHGPLLIVVSTERLGRERPLVLLCVSRDGQGVYAVGAQRAAQAGVAVAVRLPVQLPLGLIDTQRSPVQQQALYHRSHVSQQPYMEAVIYSSCL